MLDNVIRGLAAILLAFMFVGFSVGLIGGVVGCIAPDCCPADCCPDCNCPNCPDDCCPDNCCPDGVCPLPAEDLGILTEAEHFAAPANRFALDELKFDTFAGACPSCPTAPIYYPSQPSTPIVYTPAQPAATKPDPLNEAKTGSYACQRCKQGKVGTLFHTSWTEAGRPVTYLCVDCWERSTPRERVEHFEAWYAPQSIDLRTEAAMRSAVVSDQ